MRAVASHDLRTPLNAIIGFADLMGRELFGPLGDPRYEDYVRHIRTAGRDLLRSAEDTLALIALLCAPASTRPSEPVSLSDLAAEAWHGLGPESMLIRTGLAGIVILADRRALRRTLDNLFIEARSLSPATLQIALSAIVYGDVVTLTLKASGSPRPPNEVSAPLSLARTLLELQGSRLVEAATAGEPGWWVSFDLDRAVQPDFFRV